MIQIWDKTKCVGCYSCYNICPTKSIKMVADAEGFWYPETDKKTCIGCNRCEQVCPVLYKPFRAQNGQNVYAAFAKDAKVRMESSSGGMFSLLAQYVLSQGGVVFGAAFDLAFQVHHVAITSVEDLGKLRGSKYVQSCIGNTFEMAQEYLKKGCLVLFSGTPCQIDGLHKYLNKEYDTLITQDVICHGVASPFVWKKYLEKMQNQQGKNITNISFRNKETGWRKYSVFFEYENGVRKTGKASKNPMMRAYLNNLCLRPSCYFCPSKGRGGGSDITLADFWNIADYVPEYDDDRGVSLIVCHTEKGQSLLNKVFVKASYQSVPNTVLDDNIPLKTSSGLPQSRTAFFNTVRQVSFDKAVNKYCHIRVTKRLLYRLKAVYTALKKELRKKELRS